MYKLLLKNWKLKKNIYIDEQVVPFKAFLWIKQYNPNKLKKWGCKLYVWCDDEGLVYNFEVHTGKIGDCTNQPDIGAWGYIVLTFLENVDQHKGHKLFMDNWYTGIALATTLMKDGISLSGTIRNNRLKKNCKILIDNDLKKNGRALMK